MRKHHVKQPKPTGDAVARYEALSHSGSTWFDLAVDPADGTDGGTLAWPVFDGGAWVLIGQPAKLDFAGAFSIAFWSKQSTDAPAGWERIITRDNATTKRCFIVNGIDPAGNSAAFVWMSGTGLSSCTTAAFALDVWRFVVVVNEGVGGDLVIFVNGSEAQRTPNAGGVLDVKTVDAYFGKDAGASSKYQGSLDTVRFYARALSADEILRDYHAGAAGHV